MACGIILLFIWWSDKDISGKGGFSRDFLSIKEKVVAKIPTVHSAQRISNIDSKYIYVCDVDPRIVHRVALSLTSSDTVLLSVPADRGTMKSYKVIADSLGGRLFLGNYGASFFSPYNATDTNQVIKTRFETPLFTRVDDISASSLVLRGFDSTRKEQLLYKIDKTTGSIIGKADLFGATNDGGFSTDGMLKFDNSTQQVIYIQYYKNTFFCLDTNLNLRYSGKTIDTTNSTLMEAKRIEHEQRGGIISKNPLRQLFRIATVNNGTLFIASKLQANNDDATDRQHNQVIDTYNLITGNYTGSFYLPQSQEDGRLKDLWIKNGQAIALYDKNLVVYKITPPL